VLIATIGIEQFTGGLATAAFVAYLSALCDKRFTATQYALLTAFSSLLQTLASTSSGYLVSMTGWFDYFIITAVAAVPGLIMLYWMQRRELTGLDASGDEPAQSPDTA
jgi:PAT family beta-lactamase induction signal transducer AmpG